MKGIVKCETPKRGLVYRIYYKEDFFLCYVGSTKTSLKTRWKYHKKAYKKWLNGNGDCISIFPFMKDFGFENFEIEVLEEYEVVDILHLQAYEQLWMNRLHTCVNKNASFVIDWVRRFKIREYYKTYYEENKEKVNERHKKYNQENKEKVKGRQKKYREENNEKVKEQNKKYREGNKEKEHERHKKYREENKEKLNEQSKKYREENKEKINKRQKELYEEKKDCNNFLCEKCNKKFCSNSYLKKHILICKF